MVSDANQLPGLGSGEEFRYDYCSYAACSDRQQAGERFLVFLVLKNGRVFGYLITALAANGSAEIEILDVDASSRRSSGLKADLTIEKETFLVGVVHLLVIATLRAFQGELKVDATDPPPDTCSNLLASWRNQERVIRAFFGSFPPQETSCCTQRCLGISLQ